MNVESITTHSRAHIETQNTNAQTQVALPTLISLERGWRKRAISGGFFGSARDPAHIQATKSGKH